MTENERYGVLLGELAEKLDEKNKQISFQNWQIVDLKSKLETAENFLADNKNKIEKRG